MIIRARLAAILLFAIPLLCATAQAQSIPTNWTGEVVRVVDGDTIVVLLDGVSETIRIIGIDTPETVDPRKPVQAFGHEALAYTKKTLSGKVDSPRGGPGERSYRASRQVQSAPGLRLGG